MQVVECRLRYLKSRQTINNIIKEKSMNLFLLILSTVWLVARLLSMGVKFPSILTRRKFRAKRSDVFEHYYLECKSLYLYCFKRIPSTTHVDNVDVGKAFDHIREMYGQLIADVHQACFFSRQENKQVFRETIFVLRNKVIVQLAPNYASILYAPEKYVFVDSLVTAFSEFKLPEKSKEFEINVITFNRNGLDLKALAIQPTNLDLDLYYNDDFKQVHDVIRSRLSQQNDKGIVLLHGIPGTGKTTYLRHLIGELDKRVLFVSPSVAGQLMNPEFIDLLIDNPNAILIIEDAENIIMDRKQNSNSSVSNLLNLSDGLLSDCLSVQIICTFNSSLSMIDSALMRKGRLIASYEFGKLTIGKAQRLSDQLGLNQVILKPMTLAEITNPEAKDYQIKKTNTIGFNTSMLEN
jgi:ATPase family protein associated with various cellular activities (AAA)